MVTPNDVRARVETDLDDATLQALIDAETEAVEAEAGGTTESQVINGAGLSSIYLNRPAASITEIRERRTHQSDQVVLAADDYRLLGKYQLVRLAGGTNPALYWGAEVEVDYVPEVNQALRDRVIVDLVRLAIDFKAFDAESIGDLRVTQSDYAERRQMLLDQLREGRSVIL